MGQCLDTPRSIMRGLVAVILSLGLVLFAEGSARGKRETEACEKAYEEFDKCTTKAYADYQAGYEKGDDKTKPDWQARKSCNYMTATVEDCGNKLVGECKSQEEVNAMKDEQFKTVLVQLKTSISEWDTDKCPATKAHVDRLQAAETEEADEAPVAAPETGEQNTEPEPTDSATSATASVLFLVGLTIFI